jgi:hypothetical protein
LETGIMKKILFLSYILILLILFVDKSYCLEIFNMRDQSTLRCRGGVVAIGDSERDVQDKCGDPLEIANRQDFGPIWIYHFRNDRFMFYLSFLHGNLQRIGSAPCDKNRYECFDLR